MSYFKSFGSDNNDILDRAQFEKTFAEMDKDENEAVSFWQFMVWLKWVPVIMHECKTAVLN